ncbi:fatty acid desaturase [Inquilinus sp. Marseille-Q2685]|uniref:fatty acid desaturase n=1 Tax=Inquilinus sp. Marseille-Q2685 TaxID=2866581 RepID=UPI001CE487AC|nr:fatty acid desaturase [Inquilinus sp. Marseille-Q2685]
MAETRALPPEALKALSRRSDAAGLRALARHLGLIAAGIGLVLAARGSLWVWPAMALLGAAEISLFAPLHETTPRTPFRSLWLTRLVGWVAGFLLVLPPEGFRLFHRAHHRHTQDPERDPELIGAKPLTRGRYRLILTGLPYWAGQILGLLRTAAGRDRSPWIPAADRPRVTAEARIYLLLYAAVPAVSLAAGSALALLLWVGPVVLAQPLLRWVLLAEHSGCVRSSDRWANTRTTLAGLVLRLLFWNASYHTEHHLAPGVPFHALPRMHALVSGRLAVLSPGYPAAHAEIRRTLA